MRRSVRPSRSTAYASTNASLGDPTGASTRNLSATNIESVEVVTGVPSAEYGDISSGVVKISTRKGKTPYTVTLSTNPRTEQIAASKGFDLGRNHGVLNSNVEYTRATKNPTSPYTSYPARGWRSTTRIPSPRFCVSISA